jgi:hydrogenase expression/formation protein HypC
MCLAIPGRIVAIEADGQAVADVGGVRTTISLLLLPETKLGDYVLVHTGFALSRVDEDEAARIFAALQGMLLEEEAVA